MKLSMSNTLLTYLCREIESGRPLAALLRAAEYLPADSPVWKALSKKAQPQLAAPQYAHAAATIAQVLQGATMSMLSGPEQVALTKIQERSTRCEYVIPPMPHRRTLGNTARLRKRG